MVLQAIYKVIKTETVSSIWDISQYHYFIVNKMYALKEDDSAIEILYNM
jgi:hypothetical protein